MKIIITKRNNKLKYQKDSIAAAKSAYRARYHFLFLTIELIEYRTDVQGLGYVGKKVEKAKEDRQAAEAEEEIKLRNWWEAHFKRTFQGFEETELEQNFNKVVDKMLENVERRSVLRKGAYLNYKSGCYQVLGKRLHIVHARNRRDFIRYPEMFLLFKAHNLIEDRAKEIARVNKMVAESNFLKKKPYVDTLEEEEECQCECHFISVTGCKCDCKR